MLTSLSAHMVAICSTWLSRRNSLRSGASGAVYGLRAVTFCQQASPSRASERCSQEGRKGNAAYWRLGVREELEQLEKLRVGLLCHCRACLASRSPSKSE